MLYKEIKKHTNSDVYPMHMPGHKGNKRFLPPAMLNELDITEIYGFDDLHNPHGILLETETLAAELYGSRKSLMLVNGTTVGILASIGAHTERGDKILAVDNYHWSTSNAAKLFGLELITIDAEIDENSGVPCSISPKAIEHALLENPKIKLVIITSPTYEGVVSDVAAIAAIAHAHGCLLIVDSAHGAHLGFSDTFPKSATVMGADIVVISLHKTLPAMTQCSLLHVCSERVNVNALKDMLYILQTSSPSYVLMSSIDYCLRLLKSDSVELFRAYEEKLSTFSERVKELKMLSVLHHGNDSPHPDFYDFDLGKIVITTKNSPISSEVLAYILRREHKIEIERVCDDYIIAMTSICDTSEGFKRLADALIAIDETYSEI
ncbi:MAG: aminotransferase class I/II-fold pyridoxal phosphate-dependent enzyme [Oscillospiraceae bacterium]|nr:aminotransferase class I/II-fold pyridoxal phosphate-dependent enzyme [Oscillospiraceae bacterium]